MGSRCSSESVVEPIVPPPEKWLCAFRLTDKAADMYELRRPETACDCIFSIITEAGEEECISRIPPVNWWQQRLHVPVPLNEDEWVWAAMSGQCAAFLRKYDVFDVSIQSSLYNKMSLIQVAWVYAWPAVVRCMIQRHPLGVLNMLELDDEHASPDLLRRMQPIELERSQAYELIHKFRKNRSEHVRPLLRADLHAVMHLPDLADIVYDYLDLTTRPVRLT